MKQLLIFCATIFIQFSAISQIPVNLVPNPSFENGATNTTECNSTIFGLDNWVSLGFTGPNNTPEWRNILRDLDPLVLGGCPICTNPIQTNPFLDLKCIKVGLDGFNPTGESLYTTLANKLQVGKKYKIRILGLGAPSHISSGLIVDLTIIGVEWDFPANRDKDMLFVMNVLNYPQNICKAKAYETIVTIDKDNIQQIVLQASSNFFYFDRVELYEYCTENLTRQNRIYKFDRELEEAGTIIAGQEVITNVPTGYVTMLDGSITKYKASKEVNLKKGFYVNRGADFLAKIAPCGSECPTTNIQIPTQYVLCGNNCIKLDANQITRLLTFQWTSSIPGNLDYLSSLTSISPTFCPPTGAGVNTYEYDVHITNACNEQTIIKVKITHFPNVVSNPAIIIGSDNLATKPSYPEITVNTSIYTEYLNFDILDCVGNILKSYTYDRSNGLTSGIPFTFLLPDFLDPCGCYKVRISTKNYCNDIVVQQILDWDRETAPTNLFASNIVICKDGKRLWYFSGKGVKSIEINLYDRWGVLMFSTTKDYNSDPLSQELPNNWSSGTYFFIVKFKGCDGSDVTLRGSILITDCVEQFNNGGNDSNSTQLNGMIGISQDSLAFNIFPNPITLTSKINFRIPSEGGVSIKLLNKNFEVISVLYQNSQLAPDLYSIDFNSLFYQSGLYYCILEFQGSSTIKSYKLIMIN